MKYYLVTGLLLGLILLSGCSWYSHTNIKGTTRDEVAKKASLKISQPRGKSEKTLFILALSGGGSRAAYWSGNVMLALEKVFEAQGWNLLHEVDAISSVSGGSLPAAYYAISTDVPTEDEQSMRRIWNNETVRELMRRDYRSKWIGNWFWPNNIAKYWFTAYDRSDIMAQTLADNLYDQSFMNRDLRFRDLNPKRPNLIINATNGTSDHFGELFSFTNEQFNILNSDLGDYEIARAVMASAAFPGGFNYMTLKDHSEKNHYLHVFDGGNYDNLGLRTTIDILKNNCIKIPENNCNSNQFDRVVVILVDSYISGGGIDHNEYDGRSAMAYGVDLNLLDSFDALLFVNREQTLEELADFMRHKYGSRGVFCHISFDDVKDRSLQQQLQTIKTDFNITPENADAIDAATAQLIVQDNLCLQQIKLLLEGGDNTNDAN
ncbi:MAG: patatin-like phospholipase family protein [Alphaproteobacteria bacterium]|nr:patatin-like phospholipase family protein [Alphaproteobacteria bacterium]